MTFSRMRMAVMALLVWQTPLIVAQAQYPGVESFVVPSAFPTSVFSSYYQAPAPTSEPQPALYDAVLNITYPLNLTNPKTIPTADLDPVYYPKAIANVSNTTAEAFIKIAVAEILAIVQDSGSGLSTNCSKCVAALSVAKLAAQVAPQLLPAQMVSLCESTGFGTTASCTTAYAAGSYGAVWTQVLSAADVTGLDGQYICNSLSSNFCAAPSTSPLNTTGLFPKPKPANATAPAPSGNRTKVLHLSDLHLDARYQVASEANCTSGLCCRYTAPSTSNASIVFPAPLYGAYKCDSPYNLALAALQSIGPLTGTSAESPLGFTIYTGDLVAHDAQNQLSMAYVEYTETSVFQMFKSYISGAIYAVLGNHDSSPEAQDAPHSLEGDLGQQLSWNYDHVSSLWEMEGWLSNEDGEEAKAHYAAYSVKTELGLRIITLNTDFWYKQNYWNFINTTNPDVSGGLQFLIDELQKAEDCGERVWILGHVLSGWDGTNPLPNPSNLFYQIIDRYSPHVIANIFFGHTHEDQFTIFYSSNGTSQTSTSALTTAWIGPSITPLTNLNSGYRLYSVDTASFDIYDAYTFYADVSEFSELASTGPTFQFEYSTREVYGEAAGWPADAPLNATFWHGVTEAMEGDTALVTRQNQLQGKNSVRSPNCTSVACAEAKICYMRSGSVALGRQCAQGFASVQSPFTGKN